MYYTSMILIYPCTEKILMSKIDYKTVHKFQVKFFCHFVNKFTHFQLSIVIKWYEGHIYKIWFPHNTALHIIYFVCIKYCSIWEVSYIGQFEIVAVTAHYVCCFENIFDHGSIEITSNKSI